MVSYHSTFQRHLLEHDHTRSQWTCIKDPNHFKLEKSPKISLLFHHTIFEESCLCVIRCTYWIFSKHLFLHYAVKALSIFINNMIKIILRNIAFSNTFYIAVIIRLLKVYWFRPAKFSPFIFKSISVGL
jgi:hypothetical protein